MKKTVVVDDQALDLIRQLCTRISMIMEDEAETALIWDEKPRTGLTERLDQLNEAGTSITRVAQAACCFGGLRRGDHVRIAAVPEVQRGQVNGCYDSKPALRGSFGDSQLPTFFHS
jgi:hypothetical protein